MVDIDRFNSNIYIGKSCIYSVIQNIMLLNNIKFSEIELFIMSNGLKLEYNKNKFSISLALEECLNNFKKYKIYITKIENNIDIKKYIDKYFRNSQLALIETKTKFLTYQPLYNNSFSLNHCIMAYDYNFRDNILYIADTHMINDNIGTLSTFTGEVKFDILREGIEKIYFFDISKFNNNFNDKYFLKLWKKYLQEFLNNNALKSYIKDIKYMQIKQINDLKSCALKIVFDNKFLGFMFIINYIEVFLYEYNLISLFNSDLLDLKNKVEIANYMFIKSSVLLDVKYFYKGIDKLLLCYYQLNSFIKSLICELNKI